MEKTGLDSNISKIKALEDRIRELERTVEACARSREELLRERGGFDRLFHDAPFSAFLWERRGDSFYLERYNRQAEIKTAGLVSSFLNAKVQDVYPDLPEFPIDLKHCLDTGRFVTRTLSYRSRFITKALPIKVRLIALPPDRVAVAVEDLSEKERVREELEQARAISDETSTAAGAGHWEYDPATMKSKWSEEIYRIFGYEPDGEPVPLSFLIQHIHPEDRERVARHVEQSLACKDCCEGEYRIVRKDGRIRHVRSRARIRRGKDGTPVWMGGAFQDVTSQIEAEELSLRNEKTLGILLENLTEVFWTRDLKTEKILYVSKAYEEIWGKPRQTLYENPQAFMDNVAAEDRDRAQKAFEALRRRGEPFRETYWIERPDGERRRIRARAFIVRDRDGGPALVAGMASDETDSWRSGEALRESEERYKTVAEHSPQAIFVIREGRIAYSNKSGAEALGAQSPEDLSGAPIEDFYSPEYIETGRERLANAMRGEANPLMDIALQRLDGTRVYLRSVSGPIEYDGARCVLIMGPEVTGIRMAEESLLASEERFRSLFENAPLAYQSLDCEGRILDVNRKWLDVLGYAKDEAVGAFIGNFLPPGELAKFREAFPAFKECGQVDGKEFYLKRKDGGAVLCRFDGRIQYDAAGRFLRTHCIFSDVTEENRRRETLERESMVNLAQADIARTLTQPGSTIVQAARVVLSRAARITGSSGGAALTAGFSGGGRAETAQALLVDGQLTDETLECSIASGPGRFFGGMDGALASKAVYANEEGDLSGLGAAPGKTPFVPFLSVPAIYENELYGRIFLVDPKERYTEADLEAIRVLADLFAVAVYRAHSRERLVAAMEKAEAANKAKSTFLANMSHELRTPLNHVLGCMQLLETTSLDEEQAEYVQLARQGGRNLTRLLSDILDLARMEAGKISLVRAPFSLREALGPLRTVYGDIAGQKGLALNISVDPFLPETLEGDGARLRQILLNLVGNAVKFTERGQVDVSFGMLPHGSYGGLRLYVEIKDTGIGIPDDMLAKVFEPFTQVEDAYTRKYQGAGIGLQIVKRMVALLGGTLCVASDPKEGTLAILSIPLGTVVSPGAARTESPGAQRTGGRVLLVEDDLLTAKLLTGFLEKLGYASQWADNGLKALEMLPGGEFDAVLMDIQMPVKNGLETVKEIRTNPAYAPFAKMPVIAMTAYAMRGDKEKFLEAGMDAYLAKPVHLKELESLLGMVLSGQPATAEAAPRKP